jgi:outer membrane lipoprotein-sorting protein
MHKLLIPLLAAFAFAPAGRADDAADAKSIVEKAIKARGEKPDAKTDSLKWKEKGKVTVLGFLPYTANWTFQAPDKYRFAFTGEFGDAKIHMTVVVNGDKAWASEGGKAEELTGEKLVQTRNEAYQLWVLSLTPLVSDKGFTLATAKGQNVGGKPTVAVKVTRDKKPAITLYFDKESGLLVKREMRVKDELQKWKDVLDEAYFSDYKEAGGVKFFTKLKVVRDGKPMIDATLSDQKVNEKLDAKLFEKP